MTTIMKKCSIVFSCSLILLFTAVSYAEFDVDQSDSLDFESFHANKKSAIKIYENKKPVKKNNHQKSATNFSADDQTKASSNSATKKSEARHSGIYEIRERYTLNKSIHTPYSAFYVIESLHRKMAERCPQGWEKQREWSVAIEDDFYMHYQFLCI